jgi:hypothetical protein
MYFDKVSREADYPLDVISPLCGGRGRRRNEYDNVAIVKVAIQPLDDETVTRLQGGEHAGLLDLYGLYHKRR